MSTVYPLDHLTGTGRSLAYRGPFGVLWVFTDFSHQPTPWLALKRQSLQDDDLERLGSAIEFSALQAIHDRLMVQFNLLRRDDWFGMSHLRSQFRSYIERANIKVYKLSSRDLPRILNPDDTLFGQGRWATRDAVAAQRQQLAQTLANIVNARWYHKDLLDRTYHESAMHQRAAILTGAVILGAVDGIESLGQALVSLAQLGGAIINFAADTLVAAVEFQMDLLKGDFGKVQNDLQGLGLKIVQTAKELKHLAEKGAEMLNFLLKDPLTRQALWDYFDAVLESIPYVERYRIGSRLVVEIGLEVLIALATAGLGNLLTNAGRATRIGHFSLKAIEELAALYHKMKAAALRRLPEAEAEAGGKGGNAKAKPKPNPHPGLHNQEWDAVDAQDFKTRRPVDMDNLSDAESEAALALKSQGRKDDQIAQVLSSGDGFQTKQLQPGDKLYGFDNQTNKYGAKNQKSPYWLDETGYQDVKRKFYKDGAWDKEGVKNYLALPCYNRADVIDTATVTQNQTAIQSTIGKATEQIGYTQGDYSTGMLGKIMPGGGTQITPDPSKLSSVTRLPGTP